MTKPKRTIDGVELNSGVFVGSPAIFTDKYGQKWKTSAVKKIIAHTGAGIVFETENTSYTLLYQTIY